MNIRISEWDRPQLKDLTPKQTGLLSGKLRHNNLSILRIRAKIIYQNDLVRIS